VLPPAARLFCLVLAAALVAHLFVEGGDPDNAGLFAAPWDKLAHLCFYAAVAGLLLLANSLRAPLAIWLVVVGIGALDEWVQRSASWRSSDPIDLAADALGALLAVTVYRRLVLRGPRLG
jgi:VanZ family protein